MADSSKLTFLHSPVHLLAQFASLMQARFSDGRLPWKWDPNEGASGIFVSTEFSIPKDFEDASPAIVVTRGTIAHNRDVIADSDQKNKDFITKRGKNYWATAEADLRIECVGQTRGESATIADLVQATIHMTRDPICEAFTLRDISAVVMQPTITYERDERKWMTAVDFRVYFEERWFVIPSASELRKASVNVSGTTEELQELVNATQTDTPEPTATILGPQTLSLGPSNVVSASDLVFLHSPINLLAQFVSLLRTRFSDGRLPWTYRENEGASDIFVETEFSVPNELEDASPTLIVGRGSVVHRRDVIGDTDQNNKDFITKRGKNYWSTGEIDLRIECIGQTKGEASLLGDIVQSTVHMTRDPICEAFTLRDVSPVTLSPVAQYERDERKWRVAVDFRVFFENRWFGIPLASQLRKITFYGDGTTSALIPVDDPDAPDPGPGPGPSPTDPVDQDELVKATAADTTAGYLYEKLVAGANVSLSVLNVGGNEQIQITAAGGSGGGSSVERRDYLLSLEGRVPNQGEAYLFNNDVALSVAPIVVTSDIDFFGASIKVDQPDVTNDYVVEFLVNGVVQESLSLPSGSDEARSDFFSYSMSAGDDVSARLRRTSGSGRSDFRRATVAFELGGVVGGGGGGGGGGEWATPVTLTAGEGVDAGDLLVMDSSGEMVLAHAQFSLSRFRVFGVSTQLSTASQDVNVNIRDGDLIPTKFATAPAAISNGQTVYLSASYGEATLTPPASSGNVIYEVGILQGADGATVTPEVLFRPKLIVSVT